MLKKILSVCTAVICISTSAFAADIISPETIIANSAIGTINVQNMIESIHGNTDGAGGGGVIAPTTVINGLQTNLLNVINNIVDVNVKVDANLVSDIMAGKSLPTSGITDRICNMLSKMKTPSENQNGTKAETDASSDNEDFSQDERRMLELCNEARREKGLSPLTLDKTLCRMARFKSQDMSTNSFSHSGSYGELSDLLKKFNVTYSSAGENIAYGTQGAYTIEKIFDSWMNSDGHRANILGNDFTKLGYGMYSDGTVTYYTQEFIR